MDYGVEDLIENIIRYLPLRWNWMWGFTLTWAPASTRIAKVLTWPLFALPKRSRFTASFCVRVQLSFGLPSKEA